MVIPAFLQVFNLPFHDGMEMSRVRRLILHSFASLRLVIKPGEKIVLTERSFRRLSNGDNDLCMRGEHMCQKSRSIRVQVFHGGIYGEKPGFGRGSVDEFGCASVGVWKAGAEMHVSKMGEIVVFDGLMCVHSAS